MTYAEAEERLKQKQAALSTLNRLADYMHKHPVAAEKLTKDANMDVPLDELIFDVMKWGKQDIQSLSNRMRDAVLPD